MRRRCKIHCEQKVIRKISCQKVWLDPIDWFRSVIAWRNIPDLALWRVVKRNINDFADLFSKINHLRWRTHESKHDSRRSV